MRRELIPYFIKQCFLPQSFRMRHVRRMRSVVRVERPSGDVARQLFIDLSVMRIDDAGTGIQRVVRALALKLARDGMPGWSVKFVAATRKRPYRRFDWPSSSDLDEAHISVGPNDVFLGLDFSLDAIRRHQSQLIRFRRDGAKLWFLVHDLLPVQKPGWFSRNTVIRYREWLQILAGLGDGFLCNSEQTQTDLRATLAALYGVDRLEYRTQVLPMGFDIGESLQDEAIDRQAAVRPALQQPFVLIVGTLEPRKGHADVIHAFDLLWRKGSSQRLVLIGRLGWHVGKLRALITSHPEYGRRLFWLDDVDDPELIKAYQACDGVIVASYGEGFGLPMVEALGYGKPVLARALPVFRPYHGRGLDCFPIDVTPSALAARIEQWLGAIVRGDIQVAPPQAGWADAMALIEMALSERDVIHTSSN